MFAEILADALADSAKMVPLLLAIYIAIELFEYKFGNIIKEKVERATTAGPLVGAVAGAMPQCGFSVMATALYTQRLATIGTLLAVYLSTSDEAIPIMMAQPEGVAILMPFVITKIAIGIAAGYAIDFVFFKKNRKTLAHIKSFNSGTDAPSHHHEKIGDEASCCGHIADATSRKFDPREILLHPILHTAKIFFFIFCISALIGSLFEVIGAETIAAALAGAEAFQPLIMALVGLIPNCAASVAITELYLTGAITYGAALAGLCASGGLGLLVLAREEVNKKNVYLVLLLLLSISLAAGYVAQSFSL